MIVAYASDHETADSMIERTVGAFPHPDRIWVVTNDRAEGNLIISMGAHIQSVDWLIDEIQRGESDLQTLLKTLSNHRL